MPTDYEIISDRAKIESMRGRMCANTSINFLGSLVLQDEVDAFYEEYPTQENVFPKKVEHAVQMVGDVPLFVYEEEKDTYHPVKRQDGSQIYAPSVLVKQGCGNVVGVVLQGELSGLVLEVKGAMPKEGLDSRDLQKGMVVSRLWNEEPIREGDVPYPVEVDNPQSPLAFEFIDDVRRTFKKKFSQKIPSYLKLEKDGQKYDRSTTLLFRFLEKRGIPFDKARFKFQLPNKPADADLVK